MRRIVILLIFLLNSTFSFASDCEKTIMDTANRFVQFQYQGKLLIWEKSENIVVFSKKRELSEMKRDPEFGGRVLSLTADPLLIVDSYVIESCKKANDKAGVVVKYSQLAKTVGEGDLDRKIIVDVGHKLVTINLMQKDKKWYIIDPPPPHVSIQIMREVYAEAIKSMADILKNPKISHAQKRQYEQYKKELETIETLPGSVTVH